MPYQKSGIPLPVNPDVQTLRCIALYIPDDDIYLQALGGQVTELAKWTTWEKRGDNSAAIAAERWKDANDKTWEELWTKGVIMTCGQVDELIDLLGTFNQTLINNNKLLVDAISRLELTVAPLDCIPCEDRDYTIPLPLPDPDPDNPPVGNDAQEWADYLCRATNYLWFEHVSRGGAQLILALTTGGGLLSVAAASQILYATGIGAPIAFMGTIIIAIAAVAVIYDQTEFEDTLDDLANGAICTIVNSSGAETAVSNLRAYLVAEDTPQDVIDYIMSVAGTAAMNKLFSGDIVVPDEFVAPFDCNDCGSSELPPLPEGWYFAPVAEANITDYNVLVNPDLVTSAITDDITSEVLSNTLDTNRVAVDRDNVLLDAGGAITDIRRGYVVTYTYCERPVNASNTNADACIDIFNGTNSRAGWTTLGRYQFRYRQSYVPQAVIDAVETLPDVASVAVAVAGGDVDNMANYFDIRQNGFNTNGFIMSYKIWYLVQVI